MNKNKLAAMFLASVMCFSNSTKVGAHGWLYHIGKAVVYLLSVKIVSGINPWGLNKNVSNHTSLWWLANISGFVLVDCGYDWACEKIKNYIVSDSPKSVKTK